jgi:hypothetical protein
VVDPVRAPRPGRSAGELVDPRVRLCRPEGRLSAALARGKRARPPAEQPGPKGPGGSRSLA